MERSVKYLCKENDCIIRIEEYEDKLDEFQFSDCIDTEQLIIGAKDLQEALGIMGYIICKKARFLK